MLEANITVFTFFGEKASSCFQVIAVIWDVVEKDKMTALQQLSNEHCLHLCLCLKKGPS